MIEALAIGSVARGTGTKAREGKSIARKERVRGLEKNNYLSLSLGRERSFFLPLET
jgi:hypothetical protein